MKPLKKHTIVANFVILSVLAFTLATALLYSTPNSAITASTAIYQGETTDKNISLMFNVYQNTQEVAQIADILVDKGFSATFFIGGIWAVHNLTAMHDLHKKGFELCNHGFKHLDHKTLSVEKNKTEVLMTEKLIRSAINGNINTDQNNTETKQQDTLNTGSNSNSVNHDLNNNSNVQTSTSSVNSIEVSKLFAPPSGSIGDNMFKACDELGYKVIMWTRDTIDWRDQDPALITKRALNNIKSGDLILMHPTKATVEALPAILDSIKAQNLVATTVSNTISS